VIQQGESVQIIWISGHAGRRKGVMFELVFAGLWKACRPHQSDGRVEDGVVHHALRDDLERRLSISLLSCRISGWDP
jgi:hypothetical protein